MERERVVQKGFHQRVYAVVRRIPKGRVSTYGAVAGALGARSVARHVGWALAAISEKDADVPWHRVINAKGTISARGDLHRASLQQRRLEEEGVSFDAQGRIDLERYRWTPPDQDELQAQELAR